jgi:RimJ/RimL family protein N-acetyltransferase
MNVKAAIGWSEGWPGASLPICYGPAMSEVETARLLLRRWQEDDLERLVALYSDQRVARFLSVDGRPWPPERSVGAFEHFRRQWQEHDVGPWAAIDKHTDRWLGQIGLNELPRWPGPDKIEVGWDLHPSVWGQGLATEGARAALGYGFEVVGLERIISTARADNAASRRVMEKCGLAFQEEFTHKGALVVWYAIDRADWLASQGAASH